MSKPALFQVRHSGPQHAPTDRSWSCNWICARRSLWITSGHIWNDMLVCVSQQSKNMVHENAHWKFGHFHIPVYNSVRLCRGYIIAFKAPLCSIWS